MILGAHVVVYSKDAEADRAFFRDVLGLQSVDAGHGWLIFALPPGEAAFHPSDKNGPHELYFMCDGLKAEMASLANKGVKCSEVQEARWGSITKMRLPGGGEVGLYQPQASDGLGPHLEMKRQKRGITTGKLLGKLEKFYGAQEPTWPVDPYEFIVWWHCGYPASDAACRKGWERLKSEVGITPRDLLDAPPKRIAAALKPGGMVPELRALRLKQIAMLVKDELGGDLRAALAGPLAAARKTLKRFSNIADPGADRILLFAEIAPIAAVPSNCPHVLVRILFGQERENYGVTYREAQEAISAEVPDTFDARMHAYLLLKRHGQEICKRKPKCEQCPVSTDCAFFAGSRRGNPMRTR